MLASLLLAVAFAATVPAPPPLPAPGDGLGLAPQDRPAADLRPVPLPGWESPTVPPPGGDGGPARPITALVGLVAGGLAVLSARTRRGEGGSGPPGNVDVVFVPGYGSPATGTFDELIERIGLQPHQVHEFDYRTVAPFTDHAAASRAARVGPTADGIAELVAGLEQEDRWIYLVGFSKGGAAVAHLIAEWDDDPADRPRRVVGAALLDPAIASGVHGALQSAGTGLSAVPDDGGYDPIERGYLTWRDTRVGLGAASGVVTMVIRNPDSWPAGFHDSPAGLRIYDLEDGGDAGVSELGSGLDAASERIGEAHSSVRRAQETADCIRAELWQANACEWPEPAGPPARPQPTAIGRSGGGITGVNLLR